MKGSRTCFCLKIRKYKSLGGVFLYRLSSTALLAQHKPANSGSRLNASSPHKLPGCELIKFLEAAVLFFWQICVNADKAFIQTATCQSHAEHVKKIPHEL